MTILTNQLQFRLAVLTREAQRLLIQQMASSQPGVVDSPTPWHERSEYQQFWKALDTCDAELTRVLRQVGGIERQLASMKGKLNSMPQQQRMQALSRIKSLKNDLSHVSDKTEPLINLLQQLRKRGGSVTLGDMLSDIQHIGTETGNVINQLRASQIVHHRHVSGLAYTRPADQPVDLSPYTSLLLLLLALVRRFKKKNE